MAKRATIMPREGTSLHIPKQSRYSPEAGPKVRQLAQQGLFPEEWCARLGVTMATLWHWTRVHPDFRDHYAIAHHLLAAYWTEWLRTNLDNASVRSSLVLHMLKSRFPDTYGQAGTNTFDAWKGMIQEHVQAQEQSLEEADDVGEIDDVRMATDAELTAKLEQFEARRKHDR